MRWDGTARAKDRSRIVVNEQLTLVGIPDEAHDWGREHNNPRCIVDLVKKVTNVSVETTRIVHALPELTLE